MFILDIKRTAIGKFLGSLSGVKATGLIQPLFKDFIDKYPFLEKETDEIVVGNVLSSGLGQNPARIASYKSGFSEKIPAITINHVCGSGLTSIIEGAKSIKLKDADAVIAGGMESMSGTPHLLYGYRNGVKFGNQNLVDEMLFDGLYCSLVESHMGNTAENIAKKYKVSRQKQDEYAYYSQMKALKSIKNGKFKKEIIGVDIVIKKETIKFDTDEQPRTDTSLEKLARLRPAFDKIGTVTAGNSSSINDGAAAAIIVSENFLNKYRLQPLAKIIAYDYIGLDPAVMGMGSYYSIVRLLKKANISKSKIDLFEINEAFASQSVAVIDLLGIDPEKVNINGGAIALGHPLGASGARILTTLVHSLINENKKYGVAALCIGGGQGVSILIEKL